MKMCIFFLELFRCFILDFFVYVELFLLIARWISGLLLVQSQARDTESPLNSDGNNLERMMIFKGE